MKNRSMPLRIVPTLKMSTIFFAGLIMCSSFAMAAEAEHVLLFVLEGVDRKAIETNAMPVIQKLVKEGAVKLEAQSISPPLTVSSMASLLTGLPVAEHRITQEWEKYDFSRSFLRSPTMFDYLDLAGGIDTALFIMDERFYQLSRPEIYVDLQTCGKSKPQCNPGQVVDHMEDYLNKVISKGGYGFRLFTIPGLLVMHLPAPLDAAMKRGWDSKAYAKALTSVDNAIGKVLEIYRGHKVLDKTMVMVTSLNGQGSGTSKNNGPQGSTVPWITWGANIKSAHPIKAEVSLMDTGATVMEALGLETHTEWQSQAVNEIFMATPKRKTTGNESFGR